MTTFGSPSEIGNILQSACFEFRGNLLALELDFQLSVAAFHLLRDRLHAVEDGDGISLELDPDSAIQIESCGPLLHNKAIKNRVIEMRHSQPALQSLYVLWGYFEHWQVQLISASSPTTAPRRTLPFKQANDRLQRDLFLNIEKLEHFEQCREAKETRNAWIHNGGKADENYMTQTKTYARAKDNAVLPVNHAYFKEVLFSFESLVAEAQQILLEKYPPKSPFDSEKAARSLFEDVDD
ncbi:MAG: hypothetical protein HEQ23_04085 [Tepidisphaera sp.]